MEVADAEVADAAVADAAVADAATAGATVADGAATDESVLDAATIDAAEAGRGLRIINVHLDFNFAVVLGLAERNEAYPETHCRSTHDGSMSSPAVAIPTGFCPSAQGWPKEMRPTLGSRRRRDEPQRGSAPRDQSHTYFSSKVS